MAWQDLVGKETSGLNKQELLALRLELYNAARAAEEMAAKLWSAYWRSMGLPARPMTAEQVAMTKTIKPVKTPVERKRRNIIETFG